MNAAEQTQDDLCYLHPLKEAGEPVSHEEKGLQKEKKGILRRILNSTCSCIRKERKKQKDDKKENEGYEDIYLTYNPTFRLGKRK